ncbi:hypothetical protein QE152_g37057 [Popillia japonica]|uniref:Uncharacterized protein n=1 Tax=Popillia japonica TaxID=7064 RepID=A0AAW1IAZ4_POPJA
MIVDRATIYVTFSVQCADFVFITIYFNLVIEMSDSKKRRVEESKDPNVLLRWFDEMASEEDSLLDNEEEDEIEQDIVKKSDHETNSELEFTSDVIEMSDSKKRRVEESKDPNVLLRWFDEMASEEDSLLDNEEEDEIEQDIVKKSDHETNSIVY